MTTEELTQLVHEAVEKALEPIRAAVDAAAGKPAAAGTGTGEGEGTGEGKGTGEAAAAAAAAQQQKTPEQEQEERMHQAVEEYIKNPGGLSEGRKI